MVPLSAFCEATLQHLRGRIPSLLGLLQPDFVTLAAAVQDTQVEVPRGSSAYERTWSCVLSTRSGPQDPVCTYLTAELWQNFV